MPARTRYLTPWTPPPFQPSPPGRRSRLPVMGSGEGEGGTPVIGRIVMTISPVNGQAQVGQRVTITAVRVGGTAPLTYAWTGPAGTSAPISGTTNQLSWIVAAGDTGTYSVTVSSPDAPDSPQNGSIGLTVTAAPALIGAVTITGVAVTPLDPDAAAYIAAVEAADGQALESEVKVAIDTFVKGCKVDGIWTALEACNILMGARTLAGASVMLNNPAVRVTVNNFVAGDYNRRRLKGDAIGKVLLTPFMLSGVTASDRMAHFSVYVSARDTPSTQAYLGCDANTWFYPVDIGGTLLMRVFAFGGEPESEINRPYALDETGFIAGSRNSDTTVSIATPAGGVESVSYPPKTLGFPSPPARCMVFAARSNLGDIALPTNDELSWYSLGRNVDLTKLKARVEALEAALATAIP